MTDQQFVAQLAYEEIKRSGKDSTEDVEKSINYVFDLMDKVQEVSEKRAGGATTQRLGI